MVDNNNLIQDEVVLKFKELFNENNFDKALSLLNSSKDVLGDRFQDLVEWYIKNRMLKISTDTKQEGNPLFGDLLSLIGNKNFKQANTLVDNNEPLFGSQYLNMKSLLAFAANNALKLFLGKKDEGIVDEIQKLFTANRFAEAGILVDSNKSKLGDYYEVLKDWLAFGRKNPTESVKVGIADFDVKDITNIDQLKLKFPNFTKTELLEKLWTLLSAKKFNEANLLLENNRKDLGDYYLQLKDYVNVFKTNTLDVDTNMQVDKVVEKPAIDLNLNKWKLKFPDFAKPELLATLGSLITGKKFSEAGLFLDNNRKDFGDYYGYFKDILGKAKLGNIDLDFAKWPDFKLGQSIIDKKVEVKDDVRLTRDIDKSTVDINKKVSVEEPKVRVEEPKVAVNAVKEEYKEPEKSFWGRLLPWLLGLALLGLLGWLFGLFNGDKKDKDVTTETSSSVVIEETSESVVTDETKDADVAAGDIDPASIKSVFPALTLGGKTKIQDFATKFIDGKELGDVDFTKEYTVSNVKENKDGEGTRAYYLDELKNWVSEKDLFPELPTVDVDPLSITSEFPAVLKGAKVKLQDFADKFSDGLAIPSGLVGKDYTVEGVKEVDTGDSKRAYYLKELKQWVDEHNLFAKDVKSPVYKDAKYAIGETVIVADYATHYEERNEIPDSVKGKEYVVEAIHSTDISKSDIAYKLEGLDNWVIQQDIIKK